MDDFEKGIVEFIEENSNELVRKCMSNSDGIIKIQPSSMYPPQFGPIDDSTAKRKIQNCLMDSMPVCEDFFKSEYLLNNVIIPTAVKD